MKHAMNNSSYEIKFRFRVPRENLYSKLKVPVPCEQISN